MGLIILQNRNANRMLMEKNVKEKDQLEDLGVDGRKH
jgi:hypothetical protein